MVTQRHFVHSLSVLYRPLWFVMSLVALWSLISCNDAAQTAPLPTVQPTAETNTAEMLTAVPPTYTPDISSAAANTAVLPDEAIHLSVWHSWQGEKAEALADMVAAYEAENPGIRLDLVEQTNLPEVLETAVPAGEGPDLFISTQESLGHYVESGFLLPLPANFNQTYLADYFSPASAAAVIWQDEVWGTPLLQEGIALVANEAVMDDALIPANPTDFDAFLDSAISFREANPDKYLLCNPSLAADSLDAYHTAPIFFGFGGADEAGYIDDWGNVRIDAPERVAAAGWMLQLMAVSPPDAGYEACLDGLKAGRFAFWSTGPWALAALQEAGMEYKIYPFGRPFVHVTSLFMGANAAERAHVDEAAGFMTYWSSPAVQISLALAAGAVPANQQALQSPEIQSRTDIAAFGAALANGVPFPSTPFVAAQWQPIGEATSKIISGEQSPETALAAAQTAVEQAIISMQNQ